LWTLLSHTQDLVVEGNKCFWDFFCGENFGAPSSNSASQPRRIPEVSPTFISNNNKMSTISAALQNVDLDGGVEAARFPAATKQAVGLVNGAQTDVTSVYFADKILITISQGGRLSQWVIAFWIFCS
jgi:hypothetical protein